MCAWRVVKRSLFFFCFVALKVAETAVAAEIGEAAAEADAGDGRLLLLLLAAYGTDGSLLAGCRQSEGSLGSGASLGSDGFDGRTRTGGLVAEAALLIDSRSAGSAVKT